MRVSQTGQEDEDNEVIKPLPSHILKKSAHAEFDDENDGSDEWVEATENDDLVGEMGSSSTHMEVNESPDDTDEDVDEDEEELDPTFCFMCDKEPKTVEICMVHLHKHHGFFVPDIEYLKDPTGFLTYLGLFKENFCVISIIPTSDILYYGVSDIPLPELEGLKTLNVTFHDATKNKASAEL